MDKNTYVYCINCKNYKTNLKCIDDDEYDNFREYCKKCPCYECECWNPEDSMKFEDRPNYQN